MHRDSQSEVIVSRVGNRRSVPAILARRERARRERRQVFPPDFVHGEALLAEAYSAFGEAWVERALFLVEGQGVATVAYFDDYFLVVEQWAEGDSVERDPWLQGFLERRDRVIAISKGEKRGLSASEWIAIEMDRERILDLERGLLGVVRDGLVDEKSQEGELRTGHVDILSLVTLTSRLGR